MTEIFANISDELKKNAEVIWNLAMAQSTPLQAANLLNSFTNYHKTKLTDEEIEFLQFYFKMKMELIKQ